MRYLSFYSLDLWYILIYFVLYSVVFGRIRFLLFTHTVCRAAGRRVRCTSLIHPAIIEKSDTLSRTQTERRDYLRTQLSSCVWATLQLDSGQSQDIRPV